MKNLASVKEENKEGLLNIIGHGENRLKGRSRWPIIFRGIIFFLSATCLISYAFSAPLQQEFDTFAASKPHPEGCGKDAPLSIPSLALGIFGEDTEAKPKYNPQDNHGLQTGESRRVNFTQGEITRTTLNNGMVVLLKENHRIPLVSIFLCLLSGSANEDKLSGAGVTHFIEHMVFKGTSSRTTGEIFRQIESYGGKINAVTSHDYTGYTITVPVEFLAPALGILADMMMNATFSEDELEKERQVVLKEIGLTYDDPQRYASWLLWQNAFISHPYRYPILGKEQLLTKLDREDIIKFYQDKYVPNNMVLAIVGDIEPKTALSVVQSSFQDFSAKAISKTLNISEPKQLKLRQDEEEFSAGLTYLVLGYHSVAVTDEDCYALDLLGTILGQGRSSRLYKLICNEKRLAYNIEATNYTPRQPGLFIISCLLEEKDRSKATASIFEQIKLAQEKEVLADELEAAKNKIASDMLFAQQTIEVQAEELALNEGITGDYRFNEKYLQKINKVTVQDILKVANQYLHQENLSIVALTPQTKPGAAKGSSASSKPFAIGIENLTRQAQDLPKEESEIKEVTLNNGLTVLVKENHDLPLISMQIVGNGGLRAEDEDTNGLCNLVAKMLTKGTKTKSAMQIASLVESKGASLSSFSGNNSFVVSLDLLSKDFDQMLQLLADLIINPAFVQDEFKKQKKESLAEIKTREDDIFESGKKLLKETLFQRHPFRYPVVGSEKSLRKIKQRDLVNFHRQFCVGSNMVLSVFGDIEASVALEKIEKIFAGLPTGEKPIIAPEKEPQLKTIRRASQTLHKKQSLVLIGFPGTTVYQQDKYVLEIICELLSQASGRLFTQIRENQALAYALGAYQILGLEPGYFVIYVATTAENVATAKEEIWQQLQLLKQKPLKPNELDQIKRTILSKRMLNRQTNSACALESALDELYGLGYNHYREYTEQINAVGADDIARCAKQYFDLTNYAVIVVGPYTDPSSTK